MSQASAGGGALLTAAELLHFLRQRGGAEYAVHAAVKSGKSVRELGEYRLTMRGEEVQAVGPSGQPRLLRLEAFRDIFGTYLFTAPQPTGELTDLGPLFG